jgi:tol-pal system protein YbgF
MTRTRLKPSLAATLAAVTLTGALLAPGVAVAQARDNSFLDNLFNRGESGQQQQPAPQPGRGGAPADDSGMIVRLDRMESALRQLTGTLEQLQFRNQQLEMQLKRLQEDSEYRFQQLGSRGNATPGAVPQVAPRGPADVAPPAAPGRRGDLFDPAQQPNAPGAPRPLGGQTASTAPIVNEPPVGAPGGRNAGAPLDLSSLSANAAAAPAAAPPSNLAVAPPQQQPQQPAQLPPATRNTVTPAPQLATLPPSAKPQDEYDLAYGYVLHKDYGLAEQAFNEFLRKHPNERLVPDAQYWLGESQFQQQRYSEAAKAFLVVLTKHERAGKAPDSLLRLGQSLAALNKKEAACATLAEVGRKYPKASATVKRTVAEEQKRARC